MGKDNQMNSQSQQILEYLLEGNTITPLDALNRFGCFRLGARIYDLKELGYDIETIMETYGGKKYARYKLKTGQLNLVLD